MEAKTAFSKMPDNAALIYLHAYLYVPHVDIKMLNKVIDCSRGEVELDKEIKEHLSISNQALKFLTVAADIADCDWGLQCLPELITHSAYLAPCMHLTAILLINAKIRTEKGEFKQAIAHSITAMKIGHHVMNGGIRGYCTGLKIIRDANNHIRKILENTPKDVPMLLWLKEQLAQIDCQSLLFRQAVENQFESQGNWVSKNIEDEMSHGNLRIWLSGMLPKNICKYAAKNPDKFFADNQKCLADFKANILASLDLPYAEAYPAMLGLYDEIKGRSDDLDAALTVFQTANFPYVYNTSTKVMNLITALSIATKLYIIEATTNRLPDELPRELPKDLFSGDDFEYTKTDDGFVLACRGRDIEEDTIHEYKFKA